MRGSPVCHLWSDNPTIESLIVQARNQDKYPAQGWALFGCGTRTAALPSPLRMKEKYFVLFFLSSATPNTVTTPAMLANPRFEAWAKAKEKAPTNGECFFLVAGPGLEPGTSWL